MKEEALPFAQIQNWMQHMILQQGHIPGMHVSDIVNHTSKLSASGHLDIYKGSYIARLRECMRNQFGALAYALGTELFDAFADDYLAANPSQSYTLNDLGEKFPAFLQQTRPDANEPVKEAWPDFMIELARFEFALSVIFDEHAPGEMPLANESTADHALTLPPVFHLFRHTFPVCQYYLDHSQKKAPALPFPSESYCVVTRINYRLGLFVIQPAQFYFLSYMQQGADVRSAKQKLAETFSFPPADVDNIWNNWRRFFIHSGFFSRQAV